MGYQIALALTEPRQPPLSANALVVLNRMAWVAMDKPTSTQPAAEYWAGWEHLGMPWASTRSPAAVEQIVRRAIAELVTKGYVKPLGTAGPRHRQHYQITIDY